MLREPDGSGSHPHRTGWLPRSSGPEVRAGAVQGRPDALCCGGMFTLRGFAVALAAGTALAVLIAPAASAAGFAAPGYQRSIGVHELAGPFGVAAEADGDIWVADTGHNRIAEFSSGGRYLAAIAGSLDQPEGIAIDA